MYEKKDKDYKDAPRRKREWETCANLVGRTVQLLQGWLKSLRSMLGKARSIKSKSGSGSEPLPPSLQWVYDNLSFMSAGAGVLHSETLGPRRGVPCSPFADEADLEEPGPSKSPRHATPSSFASGAHSSTPLERQSRVHEWPSSKSPKCTSAEKCCGHLCTQLDEMHQHLRDPQEQFLKHLRWRVSPLNRMQLLRLENEIWDVVNRHLEVAGVGPGPESGPRTTSHTSGKATPSEAPQQFKLEGADPRRTQVQRCQMKQTYFSTTRRDAQKLEQQGSTTVHNRYCERATRQGKRGGA